MEGGERRSTRSKVAPTKQPRTVTAQPKPKGGSSAGTKRKLVDPAEKAVVRLESLLTESKSPLTTMNIFDVLSFENFICLPEKNQDQLCLLLPSTAFATYQEKVDSTHPSQGGNMQPQLRGGDVMEVDSTVAVPTRSIAALDPTFFTSPFFQSAALTFQDHLYSGWFSRKAKEAEETCTQGLRDGSMHAEWKDEAWERENDVLALSRNTHDTDLASLAQRSLIREGDVIVYERKFKDKNIVVEKDLLVRSVSSGSNGITLLLQPNIAKSLPPTMLVIGPPAPQPPILTMEGILSSVELEDEILEIDGRVSRSDRYTAIQNEVISRRVPDGIDDSSNMIPRVISAKAAKSLSVWRWREEMQGELEIQMIQERGGREPLGTVYFLRNS